MAQVNISGTVVCKEGEPAVTLKKLGESYTIAEFSVRDTEYFYYKGDDKPGQFYKVQVGGKAAEFLPDRLERGDFVSVTGQLVQRVYNDKTYLDVKDARVNQPYKERKEAGGDSLF
jgi:single-stranded DNA-binding protein